MDQAQIAEAVESPLRNGTAPFGANWQKLMMWIFIITDALLFASFLAAYGFVRLASPSWTDRGEIFYLPLIGLMTFILISSSATMASAVVAARSADRRMLVWFLSLTVLGGLCFLGMQVYEWTSLIREGATLFSNPWGVPLFHFLFFSGHRLSRIARADRRGDPDHHGHSIRHRALDRRWCRSRRALLSFRRFGLGLHFHPFLSGLSQ